MSATGIEIPIVSTYKDKGAKAASKSLNTLTKSAKALGLAFGVFQTINFSKKAVRAFADDERAAGALSKTLQNLGQSYAVLQTAGFIQNLQNTTGILDDQLRPAFTQLVNSTLDAKEAQKLLSVALDVISQLRGVNFRWKQNDEQSVGVIAQELEQVLPQLVATSDNKSVNYNGLFIQ